MTATLSATASAPTSIRVRTGHALSAVLGAGNFPILFTPKAFGVTPLRHGLMVLGAALGSSRSCAPRSCGGRAIG